MLFLYFVSLCLSFDFVLATEPKPLMEPGSCSKTCGIISQSTDSNNVTVKTLPKFPCSCSKSCSLYNDCCYDSPFRKSDERVKPSTMCLVVAGSGQFKAVSKCPKHWTGSSYFCTNSIGHLPPVTSKTTGITYTNIHCAICHSDTEHVKTWPVDLRCCPEHDDVNRQFLYRKGQLWSTVKNSNTCLCQYHLENNASFFDQLELRACDQGPEISKCSSSLKGVEEEELCTSFLDPVYLGDQIYRNKYCALCNYKALENLQCLPSVVARMVSEGADNNEIWKYCQEHQLSVCLHYLKSFNRSLSFSIYRMLSIRMLTCIPNPGKRCCIGERYHFRSRKCLKVTSGIQSQVWGK